MKVILQERKKTWLFTDVYHKSDECYVAKKDNENSDMFTGTLKGVKVAGQMGSIDITMTKYLYPDAEIQELDNTPNMLLAVKNGKADLACMNAVSAAMSVAANDDLVVLQTGAMASSLILRQKAYGIRCSLTQQQNWMQRLWKTLLHSNFVIQFFYFAQLFFHIAVVRDLFRAAAFLNPFNASCKQKINMLL